MFTPPWIDAPNRPIVLAFGGNALLPDPGKGGGSGPATPDPELEARIEAFAGALIRLLPDHAGLILVHGNGPQVGALAIRSDAASGLVPPDTLDVLVAQTQGSIGYQLAQAIRTEMIRRGRSVEVATVATQVVVDADDPAFDQPTKPIGPFYDEAEASALADEKGWQMVAVRDRGMRRVVPSPLPQSVVEIHTIADAARHGHLVIAGGGGGIPVVERDGRLFGIEAVIDKDRTAAVLAKSVRAGGFVILTNVPHVSTGFGTADETRIPSMSVTTARALLAGDEFPAGSMGPKVEAAAVYAEQLGRAGLITSVEGLPDALAGTGGTWIEPDPG